MRSLLLFSVILNFIFSMPCYALDTFYLAHAKGWHWYQQHEDKSKKAANLSNEITTTTDPILEMEAVQKSLKRTLDKAILHPNKENIERYIVFQQLLTKNSSNFSELWRQVLLEAPSLDYLVTHPSNKVGLDVKADEKFKNNKQALTAFANNYGLVFFFRSTCPYCHRFSPILKHFAANFGFSIIPVSQDGKGLPEFQHPKSDLGIGAKFKVQVVPAVFAVNPKSGAVYPISYGLVTEDELVERVLRTIKLVAQRRGDDYA